MAVILDDLKRISTKKLREWNYLNFDTIKSGVISWSRNDKVTSSIGIMVNMKEEEVNLSYNFNSIPVKTKIQLEYLISNIGNGKVWYFTCPVTLERCSKLYLINGYFMSRKAIKNTMYEIQKKSNGWRNMDRYFNLSERRDKLIAELDAAYSKSHYKGNWTKKSKQLIKLSNQLINLEPIVLSVLTE